MRRPGSLAHLIASSRHSLAHSHPGISLAIDRLLSRSSTRAWALPSAFVFCCRSNLRSGHPCLHGSLESALRPHLELFSPCGFAFTKRQQTTGCLRSPGYPLEVERSATDGRGYSGYALCHRPRRVVTVPRPGALSQGRRPGRSHCKPAEED
jgi:hypothetical protein